MWRDACSPRRDGPLFSGQQQRQQPVVENMIIPGGSARFVLLWTILTASTIVVGGGGGKELFSITVVAPSWPREGVHMVGGSRARVLINGWHCTEWGAHLLLGNGMRREALRSGK